MTAGIAFCRSLVDRGRRDATGARPRQRASRSPGRCCLMSLLTFGEVLVSTTGLEFAYSQAPLSMKGAIMAFWNLSVTIGNLWVLVVNAGVQNSRRHELHRIDRLRRDRIPDVLLRRLRVRRRARLRSGRSHVSGGRSLPQTCLTRFWITAATCAKRSAAQR